MKKMIPLIFACAMVFSACGKVVSDSQPAVMQTVDISGIDKPDMTEKCRIISEYLNSEYSAYLQAPENSVVAEVFRNPDDLWLAEPQMAYDFTLDDGVWSAKARGYEYFIIDKADDRLLMCISTAEDGNVSGGGADNAQTELFEAGKGFIQGHGIDGAPVYIADGEVYFSSLDAPDISGIELPDAEPLTAVYKLDIAAK